MVCGSVDSLHNALVTLVQLLRVCRLGGEGSEKGVVPPLVITDSPSLPHRGFMLDVAPHARVPTLVSRGAILFAVLGLMFVVQWFLEIS